MGENHALAPLPQRTLDGWHRFVASGDQRPAGLPAVGTYCVPLAVRAIADSGATCDPAGADHGGADFREFSLSPHVCRGSHDAALEFAANIGKWQLKGIDLIKFNEAGEMIEFEVMIRPIKALAGAGRGNGEPDRPATGPAEAGRGRPRLIYDPWLMAYGGFWRGRPRACTAGGLVARIGPPCRGLFGRFSYPGHAAVAQW